MKIHALRRALEPVLQQEDLNFLLTNRIPRVALTRLMGRVSRIESPLFARLAIGVWRLFTDLDLREAEPRRYRSLHECFTRALKPGVRPVDPRPEVFSSPCDGIVGACDRVQGRQVWQAKGFPYSTTELFGDAAGADRYDGGVFVTLRLTSAMYHRFHAPSDARLQRVTHMRGDTWNVNPIALKRVEKLFCRNERAVLQMRLDRGGHEVALVPVAAILVASLRLHQPALRLHVDHTGPDRIDCDVPVSKGQELGWFEHGSTIIVFAPKGFELAAGIEPGQRVRMGAPLLKIPGF